MLCLNIPVCCASIGAHPSGIEDVLQQGGIEAALGTVWSPEHNRHFPLWFEVALAGQVRLAELPARGRMFDSPT
jgi:hypothetical protein